MRITLETEILKEIERIVSSSQREKGVELEFRLGSFSSDKNKGRTFNSGLDKTDFVNLIQQLSVNSKISKTTSRDVVVMYSNNVRKIVLDGKTTFQKKHKLKTIDIPLTNIGVRLSLSNEKPTYDPNEQSFGTRIRNRTSFRFPTYTIDLSIVQTEISNFTTETYEVEMEFTTFPTSIEEVVIPIKYILGLMFPTINYAIQVEERARIFMAFNRLFPHLDRNKGRNINTIDPNQLRLVNISSKPRNVKLTDIDNIRSQNFSVTNKLNGIGMFLFISNRGIHLFNDTFIDKLISKPIAEYEDTVIHGEVDLDGFNIFDALCVKGKDVTRLRQPDRLKEIEPLIGLLKTYLIGLIPIQVKPFSHTNDVGHDIKIIMRYMYDKYGKDTVERNDGLMFTPVDAPYSTPPLKYKFPSTMSIDFLIDNKRIIHEPNTGKNTEIFDLYVYTSGVDKYGNKELQRFSHHGMFPQMKVENSNSLFGKLINKQIVEVLWVSESNNIGQSIGFFSPSRVRTDKTYPNFITIASDVFYDILNPISLTKLYRDLLEDRNEADSVWGAQNIGPQKLFDETSATIDDVINRMKGMKLTKLEDLPKEMIQQPKASTPEYHNRKYINTPPNNLNNRLMFDSPFMDYDIKKDANFQEYYRNFENDTHRNLGLRGSDDAYVSKGLVNSTNIKIPSKDSRVRARTPPPLTRKNTSPKSKGVVFDDTPVYRRKTAFSQHPYPEYDNERWNKDQKPRFERTIDRRLYPLTEVSSENERDVSFKSRTPIISVERIPTPEVKYSPRIFEKLEPKPRTPIIPVERIITPSIKDISEENRIFQKEKYSKQQTNHQSRSKNKRFVFNEESRVKDEQKEDGKCLIEMRRYHNIEKGNLITKYASPSEDKKTVLDLGFGRGGDIFKYEKTDVEFVYGIEPNREFIEESKRRLEKSKMKQKIKIINTKAQETSEILDALKKNGKDQKVDIVSSFFSLTFFFESENELDRLVNTVASTIKVGGYFIGTTMDGDRTYDFLLGKNVVQERGCYKIVKHYNDDDQRVIGKKLLIDLDETIVSDQYEWLAFFDIFKNKLEKRGLELVETKFFNPLSNVDDRVKSMSRLFRSFVFQRKETEKERENIKRIEQNKERLENEQKYKLKSVDMDRTVAFNNNIDPSVQLVRTGTVDDGSCFFHSICRAIDDRYVTLERDEREQLVERIREKMASRFTREKWETLGNGALASGLTIPKFVRWIETKKKDMYQKLINIHGGSIDEYKNNLPTKELVDDFETMVNRVFTSYKKQLEDPGTWVGQGDGAVDAIEYVSEFFNINIYIIRDTTRTVYRGLNCDALKTRNSVILLWLGDSHFETVGRLIERKKVMRSFGKDDSFIEKLHSIACPM